MAHERSATRDLEPMCVVRTLREQPFLSLPRLLFQVLGVFVRSEISHVPLPTRRAADDDGLNRLVRSVLAAHELTELLAMDSRCMNFIELRRFWLRHDDMR